MAKLNYDKTQVDKALEILKKATSDLLILSEDFQKEFNGIKSANGSNYVNYSSLGTSVKQAEACSDAIKDAMLKINNRIEAIVEYNKDYDNAPWYKKAFGTVGMAASKVGEGIVGAFEDIGDAALLVGAWVAKPFDLIFKSNASEKIQEFMKKDLSRDLFDKLYYNSDLAKYSVFDADSVASSIFRGVGQAGAYIVMGGYVGGANNALARNAAKGSTLQKLGTIFQSTTNSNALVAAIGGLGSGAEDALDHGFDLGAATLFGVKDAAVQGTMAYVAGKIGEHQQKVQAEKNLQYVKDHADEIAQYRLNSNGTEWKAYDPTKMTLDQAKAKVISGAESHYKAAITEIGKLGGYTDRLTSKAYTKGFYDMDHLMTVYNSAGKGATGVFKAATVGQFDNLKQTGKEIIETPSRVKQNIADYKEYREALSKAKAAEAAGKAVPAKTQEIIDKYLNNNRGLDIFRVSNVNPTNNIAKGGVFLDDLSHSYKLSHTRAIVGDLVGNVALGTTAYVGMNAAKDYIGDVGQAVLTSMGVDKKVARATFVNENRKYRDEEITTNPKTVPSTVAPTDPVTKPPAAIPIDTPTDPPIAPTTVPPATVPINTQTQPPTNTPTSPPAVVPVDTSTHPPTVEPVYPTTIPQTEVPSNPVTVPSTIAQTSPVTVPLTVAPTIPVTEPPTVAPTNAPTIPPTAAPTTPSITYAPTPVYPISSGYVPIPETGIDKEKTLNAYIVPAAIGVSAGVATVIAKSIVDKINNEDNEDEDKDKE